MSQSHETDRGPKLADLRNPDTRTPIRCFFAYLTMSHTSSAVFGTHVYAGVLLTVLPQFWKARFLNDWIEVSTDAGGLWDSPHGQLIPEHTEPFWAS